MRPDGELKLWDLDAGQLRRSLEGVNDGVSDLAFSPDGRRLAAAGFTEVLKVWGVESGEPVLSLGHARMAVSVACSPVGRRIATGSFDGTVTVWESETGHKLLTLEAFPVPVVGVAFSPEGLRLAAAAGDGKIKVWDALPNPSSP
jgi:WD40 repeat protein